MLRLLLALALAGLIGAAPARAWDPASAGRYGGMDLDSLDVGGRALARGSFMVGPGCASTAGAYATDGTQSWEPSCFGVFSAPGQDVRTNLTRGTAAVDPSATPKVPNSKLYAPFMIQARASGALDKEQNGMIINLDVLGGAQSAAGLDNTNTTGQLISVRQRPGPDGEKPPSTWGHNVDIHIAPGSGGVQTWGVEYDINNFNQNCYPGSSCLSSAMYFNGIGGWTNTAWLYSGGGTTQTRHLSVTVANGVVTRTAGESFNRAIYRLKIANVLYRVQYVNPDRVDASVAIPNYASPVAASWDNAMVANGVLFQGENMASDNDLALNTSAYNAITVAGKHHVGLNTASDDARFAVVASEEQKVCLKTFDGCWSFIGGAMQYTNQGQSVLQLVSVANGANGLRATAAGTGFGPLIEPTGGEATIALNLSGKGGGAVQVVSPLSLSAGIAAPGLPTAAGAVRGTLCVDTAGAVYVKTTPGACL
ncbi:hypothetical protein [Methylobacterium frigidaeris]|uniref:Uncharacterized protein n=1 Tax=Methylobacterium frigidaeris TaxID=2038277 RepID=A0AA37HFN9_9HYPH|nr:hypothetical protein [Methylobacterium frigidaeris]PIK74805.1 hypothetical protein CS379_00465 [Methylobacterium frigidaeris]GJD65187.1 hypothetical protein MPEAHAMD_5374 [Methylobacterium frigidaeris]